MSDTTTINKRTQNLEIGDELPSYVGVLAHVMTDADDTEQLYWAGTAKTYEAAVGTGLIMEFTIPFTPQKKVSGKWQDDTQTMVNNIWKDLNKRNYRYQPYSAESALLDPAAEMGDAVSVSDVFSAIYRREITFSALMGANISAPTDEEVDHEFPYISQTEREYKREKARSRTLITQNATNIRLQAETIQNDILDPSNENSLNSKLSAAINVNAGSISSEVKRVNKWAFGSDSENADYHPQESLSSRITQNATNITAKVSKTSGNNTIGFGWDLSDSEWKVGPFSGGKVNPVLTINKNGLTVKGSGEFSGKITATSGYIGNATNGFTISASAIYNGKESLTDANDGIYLGKSGIALGKSSVFKVTNAGVLTAKSGTIGGFEITATQIKKGGVAPDVKDFGETTTKITRYGLELTAGAGASNRAFAVWHRDYTINSARTKVTEGDQVYDIQLKNNGTGNLGGFNFTTSQFSKQSAAPAATANGIQYGFILNAPDSPAASTKAISLWERVFTYDKTTKKQTYKTTYPFIVQYDGTITASKLAIKGGTISIGSNFSVNKDGIVTAKGMKISGTLTVGGHEITAANLRQGAEYANAGHDDWDAAHTSTSEGGYCYDGAANGNTAKGIWDNAQDTSGDGVTVNASNFLYQGYQMQRRKISFRNAAGGTSSVYVMADIIEG